jgi:hypothetical protein
VTKKDQLLEDWLRAIAELEIAQEHFRPTHRILGSIRRIKDELSVLLKEEQSTKVGI